MSILHIYGNCRNDGDVNNEITLPRGQAFVLLQYRNRCQAVYGMSVTALTVFWDDEDSLNTSFGEGMIPLDTGGLDNHELHFCYYNATVGV